MLHIRRLVTDDAMPCRVLRLAALRDSPASFGSAFEDEEPIPLGQWLAFIAGSDERVFFGAFAQQEMVGSVGIERESGRKERHRAVVRSMYVAPAHRGQGAGRSLLAAATAHAAHWPGLEQVTLAVTAGNSAAVSLYRSEGFVAYGLAPRVLLVAGTYHDEILMVRHLRRV